MFQGIQTDPKTLFTQSTLTCILAAISLTPAKVLQMDIGLLDLESPAPRRPRIDPWPDLRIEYSRQTFDTDRRMLTKMGLPDHSCVAFFISKGLFLFAHNPTI